MKNKKFIFGTLAGLLAAGSLQAQEQTFSKIVIERRADLVLSQGTRCAVEPGTGLDSPDYEIRNGTLVIHSNDTKASYYVTVNDLAGIDIQGRGNVTAQGTLQAKQLELRVSGYGDIQLAVEAGQVEVRISGKGDVELGGSAQSLDVSISGAGKVRAAGLSTQSTAVRISGTGKVETDPSEMLDVHISGIGSVKYKRTPAKIDRSISGIGKIGQLNDEDREETGETGDGDSDTTKVWVGDKEILIIGDEGRGSIEQDDENRTVIKYNRGDKTKAHWAGFELGFNNYFTDGFDTELPDGYDYLELNTGKSIAVNLNVFDWRVKLLDYHLAFVSGLGISWNNWRFRSDRPLVPNMPSVTAYAADSIDYKKNKLTASYVTMPLLLEFNSSAYEKKTFHASAGLLLGYRIGSHTKQKYKENGKTRKVKTYDDFNLNPFRYDATFRVGYRGFTVFASYGLADLFKKNQGPELHPFTFGLTLVNW